jgi:Sec7-like guanine-nucleotide exchange factor
MADPIDNKLVDKRVAQRYLRKNLVDEKDYEKYLKALPDLADQAAPVESIMDGDDLDDDLDDEVEEDGAAPGSSQP